MGIIRLLLAISVVVAHTESLFGLKFVGGEVAVKAFYIISGFYMSLILNEKYKGPGSYRLFISNRFLRLLPLYWAVLGLTLLVAALEYKTSSHALAGALQPFFDYIQHGAIQLAGTLFLVFANLFLFGQDLVMFLGINPVSGAFFLTPDFTASNPPLHYFLIVPQAWTVAVELMFYLIAPFILRRKLSLILGLIALTVGLRLVFYSLGFNHDPWTYRFFPLELTFFLLGNLSYRMYAALRQHMGSASKRLRPAAAVGALALVLLLTIAYNWLPSGPRDISYYAVFFLLLPIIFTSTKAIKADRMLGELSYPVYISHILVVSLVMLYPVSRTLSLSLLVITSTIVFSILLNKFVAEPIERIRQSRVSGVTQTQSRWW